MLANLDYNIDVTKEQHYASILTGFFVTVKLFLLHAIQGSAVIKRYLKKSEKFKLTNFCFTLSIFIKFCTT
jgi:hypothetical protein